MIEWLTDLGRCNGIDARRLTDFNISDAQLLRQMKIQFVPQKLTEKTGICD
jgi:hypothetical protein